MTCLIGLKTRDGRGFLIADSCITWQTNPPNYEDTLQKIFVLTPNIAVGVCGDLKSAQKLLLETKKAFARGTTVYSGKKIQKILNNLIGIY